MPCIKIKQLDNRVATSGLFMGGDLRRRKLEPGEVIDIGAEVLEGGESLLDMLWKTGKIELTPEAPTRPLDYEDVKEAKLHSPSFKPRDPSEETAMLRVRAVIAARLNEQSVASQDPVNSPAVDSQPAQVIAPEPEAVPEKVSEAVPANPRAARRAALKQGETVGEEATT